MAATSNAKPMKGYKKGRATSDFRNTKDHHVDIQVDHWKATQHGCNNLNNKLNNNYNKIVATSSCGCSVPAMKSMHISNTDLHHHDHNFNISNPDLNPNPNPSFIMSKLPNKYKHIKLRRQIWPLFKQEYYNTNSSKIYGKMDINHKVALGYTYSKPITHYHAKYTPNHVNVPAVRRSSPNAAGQYPCQRSKSVIFTGKSSRL